MDLQTAISYICSTDAELKAIQILLKSHAAKYNKELKVLSDRTSSLRMINKLNTVKYKDDAIAALSDVDNDFVPNGWYERME